MCESDLPPNENEIFKCAHTDVSQYMNTAGAVIHGKKETL